MNEELIMLALLVLLEDSLSKGDCESAPHMTEVRDKVLTEYWKIKDKHTEVLG